MKGKLLLIICLLVIFTVSYKLYDNSLHQGTYSGLPTVPCTDTTLPIKQNYSFTIKILVDGKNYPLSSSIGHDFGNCLHVLYVLDSSGKVYVKTNDMNTYTLGQFFDVWHGTFNNYQMFNYRTEKKIQVFIDGKLANAENIRDIPLFPNRTIQITYQ